MYCCSHLPSLYHSERVIFGQYPCLIAVVSQDLSIEFTYKNPLPDSLEKLLPQFCHVTKVSSFQEKETNAPSKEKLVGGFNPFEKYSSNWIISPGKGENKKCLKPPPRKKWVPTCSRLQFGLAFQIPTVGIRSPNLLPSFRDLLGKNKKNMVDVWLERFFHQKKKWILHIPSCELRYLLITGWHL